MKHLADGMLGNRTLEGLSLAWNGLCDEGCFHVADMVAGNAHLEVRVIIISIIRMLLGIDQALAPPSVPRGSHHGHLEAHADVSLFPCSSRT